MRFKDQLAIKIGTGAESPVPDEFGVEREFTQIYGAYASVVRAVIFQIAGPEALDDLVQDSFVKIWRSMDSFRHESKLSSWIYRIAANTALDWLRKDKRREIVHGEIERGTPETQGAQVLNRDLIEKGLARLTPDHRAVLVFSYLHDLSIAEIASILEISEGTVKSRLHYAKAEFKSYLTLQGVQS